jgi:uncharacterized cupredoxin-like copper-binding protein
MKVLLPVLLSIALSACGVETASTAATAAALKKQELEQGKKTMEQVQKGLDQANQQARERNEAAENAGR